VLISNSGVTSFGRYVFGTIVGVLKHNFETMTLQAPNPSIECDVGTLRIVNVLLALCLFYVCYRINKLSINTDAKNAQHTSSSLIENQVVHKSLNDFLNPAIAFFFFLYYTDTGSILFVLLGYWFCIERFAILSPLVRFLLYCLLYQKIEIYILLFALHQPI
jgi:hypothetical protein